MRKDIPAHYRATLPEADGGPRETWYRIPGADPQEASRHWGVFAAYVREASEAELSSKGKPSWFNFRWAVWSYGTLCGEGFSEDEREAMRLADRCIDNLGERLRDLIRSLDIRRQGEAA